MNEAKPNRRWLRFSLSSLFLLVTAICIWLGYQASRVRERSAVINLVLSRHGMIEEKGDTINGADYHFDFGQHPERIPKILLFMGAQPIRRIGIPIGEFTIDERLRIRAALPELGDPCLGLPQADAHRIDGIEIMPQRPSPASAKSTP